MEQFHLALFHISTDKEMFKEVRHMNKSMQVTAFDGQLKPVEVDLPPPGADEVRIDVLACSVNFGDTLIVLGK